MEVFYIMKTGKKGLCEGINIIEMFSRELQKRHFSEPFRKLHAISNLYHKARDSTVALEKVISCSNTYLLLTHSNVNIDYMNNNLPGPLKCLKNKLCVFGIFRKFETPGRNLVRRPLI